MCRIARASGVSDRNQALERLPIGPAGPKLRYDGAMVATVDNSNGDDKTTTSLGPCARLIQITDPHLLENPLDTHRTVNTSATLENVIHHAHPFIRKADAVLLTGDVAQDEKAGTYSGLRDSWVNHWVGEEPSVWCLPGNHDAPVLMQAELNDSPFADLGHHRLANWEVILLDTRNPGKPSGLLGKQELERLRTRLEHSAASYFLIALHHHPLPLGHSWLDKVGLEDRDSFERIIAQDKRVRAVVFGHIHQAVDRTENDVRYMGCPSTGVQFTPNQIEFGLDNRPPGFRSISLYTSGDIDSQVYWVRDELLGKVINQAHQETA